MSGSNFLMQMIAPTGGVLAVFNPGGYLLNRLASSLIPKPQVPASLKNSQVYSAQSRQNLARLQGSQPVLYGRFRIYPDLLSQPWAEFINNEQYLYQLMCITQGQADLEQLYIGDTPIESFGDVTAQLYQPGETVDLFHNNVATNEQVQDLELVTIGAGTGPAELTFNAATRTISCVTPVFELFKASDRFEVRNSASNDGVHTVGFVGDDFTTLVVLETLVDETPAVASPVQSTITRAASGTSFGPSRFKFEHFTSVFQTHPRITSVDALDLSALNPGDTVTVTGSVNNNRDFTISSLPTTAQIIPVQDVSDEDPDAPPARLTQCVLLSRLVGPFYANPAMSDVTSFAVDIGFPKGLYSVDSDTGGLRDSSATVRVEYRVLGDSVWIVAADETFTAALNTPQRYTRTYDVAGASGRIEVKVTRTSVTAATTAEQNESHWIGLRGFLRKPITVTPGDDKPIYVTDAFLQYPDRAVLAVKARISGQLNQAMTNQFNGIFQRKLPGWDRFADSWSDPMPTSSIALALIDVITNSAYGLGRGRDELDLNALADFDEAATARGDFFNGYFDADAPTWEALNNITRVGRAVPTYDGRLFSILRDEPRTLRAALFTDQNTIKGSVQVSFDLIGEDTPRGVKIAYHDAVTFQEKTLLCGEDVNASDVTLFGCTDRDQAWREGNFILNGLIYRKVSVSFQTEMDGFVPNFLDLVTVQAAFPQWGQSARVLAVSGRELTLDQKPEWGDPPHSIRLRNIDGEPTEQLRGTGSGNVLTLELDPPIDIVTGVERERTQVAIATQFSVPIDMLVRSRAPKDELTAQIMGLLDDPRAYADPGPTPPEDQ